MNRSTSSMGNYYTPIPHWLYLSSRICEKLVCHNLIGFFFARFCQRAVTLLSRTRSDASGAMAADVDKTVAFLAKFSDEIVSMQKQTLESVLKSNRANQVKEWNAAKNF